MAIGLRSTEKRGWLPPRKDGAPSRPGLGLLVAAPLSLLLAGYPTIYLLLIFWSVVLSPAFLSIKSNPHSGHDPVMLLVGAFCLATLVAIYSGLQALALKRFAGNWSGSLFWQLFAWTGGVIVGLPGIDKINLGNQCVEVSHTQLVSPSLVACVYVRVFQNGAVFGKWLTLSPSRPALHISTRWCKSGHLRRKLRLRR